MPLIFNRKKKDTQGIADVQSGKKKFYVTKSKRAVNPETGNKIRKGSTVTLGKSNRLIGLQSKAVPGKISISNPSLTVRSSFISADHNEGKVNKRPTTMGFVKKYGENPAKVKMRMEAQAQSKPTYNYKGKEELSGINKTTIKGTPGKTSISFTQKASPVYAQVPALQVKAPLKSSGGKLKPRAMTMGGTSKGDRPANKYGVGKSGGFKLRRKKVF